MFTERRDIFRYIGREYGGGGINCTERKGDRYGHVPCTLCIERKVERERKMGGGSSGLA